MLRSKTYLGKKEKKNSSERGFLKFSLLDENVEVLLHLQTFTQPVITTEKAEYPFTTQVEGEAALSAPHDSTSLSLLTTAL